MAPQAKGNRGNVKFPGLKSVISATYTRSHGVAPGVATIVTSPEAVTNLKALGDLEFEYFGEDRTVRLVLKDCAVESATRNVGPRGHTVTLKILDRRWKWINGKEPLFGEYNVRDALNVITPGTSQGIRNLATLIFTALGEIDPNTAPPKDVPDIQNLPALGANEDPYIFWYAANPARELETLLELISWTVFLDFRGRVRLRPIGEPSQLPDDATLVHGGIDIDNALLPDVITVIAGPTVYQAKWVLQAIALDTDNTFKPLAALSFLPPGGWTDPEQLSEVYEDLVNRQGLTAAQVRDIQELSQRWVFRAYLIQNVVGGGFDIGLLTPTITSREQFLPFLSTLIDVETEVGGLGSVPKSPFIEGQYHTETDRFVGTTPIGTPYTGSFRIDRDRGIVLFPRPVYLIDGAGVMNEAKLRITIAANARDARGIPLHASVSQRMPWAPTPDDDKGGGKLVILAEDEIGTVKETYFPPPRSDGFDMVITNATPLARALRNKINAKMQEFIPSGSANGRWIGLREIELDGSIQQVTISFSKGGFLTEASLNRELVPVQQPQRRRRASVSSLEDRTRLRIERAAERREGRKARMAARGKRESQP